MILTALSCPGQLNASADRRYPGILLAILWSPLISTHHSRGSSLGPTVNPPTLPGQHRIVKVLLGRTGLS